MGALVLSQAPFAKLEEEACRTYKRRSLLPLPSGWEQAMAHLGLRCVSVAEHSLNC